jgi:hypothetical protein
LPFLPFLQRHLPRELVSPGRWLKEQDSRTLWKGIQ